MPDTMADISITAASVIPGSNARRVSKIAASTITAGQLVYQLAAGTVAPADANGASPLFTILGIAENGGGAGQRISVITEDDDLTIGATVAIGDVLIASATAGGIAPVADLTTGWYGTIVGIAKSTSKVVFKIIASGAARA